MPSTSLEQFDTVSDSWSTWTDESNLVYGASGEAYSRTIVVPNRQTGTVNLYVPNNASAIPASSSITQLDVQVKLKITGPINGDEVFYAYLADIDHSSTKIDEVTPTGTYVTHTFTVSDFTVYPYTLWGNPVHILNDIKAGNTSFYLLCTFPSGTEDNYLYVESVKASITYNEYTPADAALHMAL